MAAMPWTAVGEALSGGTGRAIALLPIGSTEPHGPHLPLDTDVIISCEMARRAADRLEGRGLRALVTPPLAYSVTEFSKDFPGAVSLGAPTALALVLDVCRGLLGQGFAAVCLVNSHLEPGHLEVLRQAAAQAGTESGKPVIFPDKTDRRWARTLTEEFKSGACHAGAYETSLVLAVRPGRVDDDLRKGLPANPISIGRKIKEGVTSFREAGGDQAYFGDPAAASAEEGDATYEILAAMIETAVLEALGGRRP